MKIIRKVVCAVQRTLGQLARQVGEESGVIVRQRKFTADSLAQTLALGYLQNPCARDEQLARIAALLGVVVMREDFDHFTRSTSGSTHVLSKRDGRGP